MSLSKPSIVSITNGDESVFLSWSYVTNATQYEIELKIYDIETKTIYCTSTTSILIKKLENDRFYSVQITASNKNERSEPSLHVMIRPKLHQSLSVVSVRPGEKAGRVCLRWTSTPTDCGFQVQRCDIDKMTGYKTIAWLPYNTVTTYEDQTSCDPTKHVCSGHYYTVKYSDTAWWTGGGVLSKKVFCMSSTDSYSDIGIEKCDVIKDNTDQSSVKESMIISDPIFIIITESGLISPENLLIERVKKDENIHFDPTSKPLITDNVFVSASSKDLLETVFQSGENALKVSEELEAQLDAPSSLIATETEEQEIINSN